MRVLNACDCGRQVCCFNTIDTKRSHARFVFLFLFGVKTAGRAKLGGVSDTSEADIQKAIASVSEKVLHRKSTSCVPVSTV